MRQSYWEQRSHIIRAAEINERQMSQLITKCKENEVTVNTLLVTTILEAAQKFDPKKRKLGSLLAYVQRRWGSEILRQPFQSDISMIREKLFGRML